MAAPKITLGDGFIAPIDIVTQTVAIVGTRGRGKMSTAKVLVEEIVSAGQQAVELIHGDRGALYAATIGQAANDRF